MNFTSVAVIRQRLFFCRAEARVATGSTTDGQVLSKIKMGGTHGAMPDLPDLHASFFLVGPGVPAGNSLGHD